MATKGILTRKQFAVDRGVSQQAVAAWIAAGMPTTKDGRIDYKSACAWLAANVQGHGDANSASARLLAARALKEGALARMRELEAKRAEGLLVDVEQAEKAWAIAGQTMRDQMRSIPDRVAPELAALTDPRQVRDRLRAEIDQVLVDLPERITEKRKERERSTNNDVV